MRPATISLCLLDAAAWIFLAVAYFFSDSDPATKGFDIAAGMIVTVLFLITAVPALVFALLRRLPKTALALALAFPAAFGLLFLAAVLVLG
ncbi:MAG: hypothetical protein ACHQRJ_14870 [Alphaproteobacteria bacterium]